MEWERADAYGIEYDPEQARHIQRVVEVGIQSDLMDTVISPRSFGLLFFNSPYGDLVSDTGGNKGYTDKRDITRRLKRLLEQAGFKVAVLRSSVDTSRREVWIAERVKKGIDVFITNPELVKTGLDLPGFPLQ